MAYSKSRAEREMWSLKDSLVIMALFRKPFSVRSAVERNILLFPSDGKWTAAEEGAVWGERKDGRHTGRIHAGNIGQLRS